MRHRLSKRCRCVCCFWSFSNTARKMLTPCGHTQACAGSDLSQEAVFDWLCLNIAAEQLPPKFAPKLQAQPEAAQVKVQAKARDAPK